MNMGFFKTFIISLLLCSLLWVAACANGGTGTGPTGSSYGSYSSFGTSLAPELGARVLANVGGCARWGLICFLWLDIAKLPE